MFVKFPSIDNFHSVRKHEMEHTPHAYATYRAKIKLHGTNAGIVLKPNGEVLAQSRSRIITPGDDNMGFAAWVEENKGLFSEFAEDSFAEAIVIFGEWCGPGIMKGTAINDIPEKIFAVFATMVMSTSNPDNSVMYVEPDYITRMVPEHKQIHVLPWHTQAIHINFSDTDSVEEHLAYINSEVNKIEKVDPWVKDTFGVEGIGEGLVFVPYPHILTLRRKRYSQLSFKAKGEKHRVVKTKNAVQMDPDVVKSINEFTELVVTDARLEQGVRETSKGNLVFSKKLIGPFLAWISKDVKKETKVELAESGLEWKLVAKSVTAKARQWYMEECEKIR